MRYSGSPEEPAGVTTIRRTVHSGLQGFLCVLAPVSKKHSNYNIRLARSSTASRWTRR